MEMNLENNGVIKTQSGIFTRYDAGHGMYAFSPYTGLIYGVINEDSKKIFNWLQEKTGKVDKVFENTIGIGFKKNIKNAEFGSDRLLPEISKWTNPKFLHKPLVLNWLITGKCTHDCTYCYAKDVMGDKVEELKKSDIKTTVARVLSYKPLAVVLTGGEPLLSPYLSEIIELLSGKVGIVIDTNGYLFSDEHIKIFKKYNVVVRISIDNQRPQINDKFRPIKGSKKNTYNGLSKAIDLLNTCLNNDIATIVHTVAIKQNINDLVAMGEKFVSLGLKVWRILRLSYPNIKSDVHKDLGYSERKYQHFYTTIRRKSNKDWNNKMQVVIQENLEKDRNSVILVTPRGRFLTESPVHGGGKIIIDPTRPRSPNKDRMDDTINWWAHYNRYLNFS